MAVHARNFAYYASIMLNAFNAHYAGIISANLAGNNCKRIIMASGTWDNKT